MSHAARAACLAVVLGSFAACGGDEGGGSPPPPVGGQSGSGGSRPTPTPTAGSGGSEGGSGGSAGSAGTGGSAGSAGTGGSAGSGGSGGRAPDAGSAPDVSGPSMPPPLAPEPPAPACKRTVPVANSGALGGAIADAVAGDCLDLADGTYTFPGISKRATAEAPIVIRAANRGKAVVASGSISLNNSAYVVIEGLTFTSSGSITFNNSEYCRLTRTRVNPAQQGMNDWIVMNGTTHHTRIDHNDIGPRNVVGNIVMFGGEGSQIVQNNRVDHNFFHDVSGGGGNGWETLRIGLSGRAVSKGFNLVEFNLFKGATGDPETISVKSSDNIVRYNTYRATNGEITLRHGNRNLVYGNFMLQDGLTEARGMRVLGADHRIFNNYIEGITRTAGIFLRGGTNPAENEAGTDFYRVYRTHIVNNTLVNGRGIAVGSTDMPPLDCVIANNIVQNSSGAAIVNVGQGTKIEGNIVFPMGAGATVGVMEGSQMIDPKLMQMDGVFRISAGSPAIDAALGAYTYVMDDMDGHPRAKADIGADEMAPGMVTRRPLVEADVGPNAP
jgi:poly(beta-D-mannuronate) lyase